MGFRDMDPLDQHFVQPCGHDDSMMDHVISPCRSCGIWGDPIPQMLKHVGQDHMRLPLLFKFPIIADTRLHHSLCSPSWLSS